jgi:hypothetical protein
MSARTFIVGSIPRAGQRVRGVAVTCSRCPATHSVPMNTVHNSKPRDQDEKLARMATRKFESDGWKIGHNAKHDLCPNCSKAPQPQPQKQNPAPEKPTMQAPAAAPKSPSEQPPRQMAIDDALLIASRLTEIYLGKDKGYADDWTDGKLAESLGVPRAWVTECRVKTYGEGRAGNDEITAMVRDAQAVRNDALGVLEQLESARSAMLRLIDDTVARLRARLETIDRQLGTITKAMQ